MDNEYSTTQIDILRHGACEGGHIFRGRTNVKLLPSGFASMLENCERVAEDWELIITSPLLRCLDFTTHFAQKKSLPFHLDERLQEMSFGDWDGKLIDDIRQNDEEGFNAWQSDPSANTPPQGEPLADVDYRVQHFLQELLQNHQGKKILLVTHGGIIRVILAQFLAIPLAKVNRIDVPYACISRVAAYQSAREVIFKLVAHNFIQGKS